MPDETPASRSHVAPKGEREGTVFVPRWMLVVLAAVGALLVVGFAFAVGHRIGERHGGFGGHGFGEHGGGRGVGVIVVLVLVAIAVAVVVVLVRHFGSRPHVARDAEGVLADRFARGEIDEAEFLRRRDALRS
jgi:putative membrane protein